MRVYDWTNQLRTSKSALACGRNSTRAYHHSDTITTLINQESLTAGHDSV